MATVTRITTKFPIDQASMDLTYNYYLNPLKAAFTAGNTINKADIDLLKAALDAFNGHYHDTVDYARIADFGNSGTTLFAADGQGNPRRSGTMHAAVSPPLVSTSNTIKSSDINQYILSANQIVEHQHAILDDTSG